MAFLIPIFLGVLQLILFVFHLFEYEVIVTVFEITNPVILLVLQIILGALSVSFVLASILESFFNNRFTRVVYRIAAVWLGFLTYLIVADIIFYVILAALLPFNVGMRVVALIGKVLLAFALGITLYGLYNARRMRVTRLDLKFDKLPESWKGKRAVWVSDLQLGQVYGKGFSEKVVNKIKTLNPDIVFVGGDLYDGVAIDVDASIAPFSTLRPPLGMYFITGNHEEFNDNAPYLSAVHKVGMKSLIDESVNVDGVELVGVDYTSTEKKTNFQNILGGLTKDKSKFYILLKHAPAHVSVAADEGVSLMICGHTHRAQMAPLNVLTHFIYKGYDYGLKKAGDMLEYTSSGAGTWGPPLKVGSKSEIVLVTFDRT
jgi:predicted MPP superfamily phosphohydrolase